ncbi:MAG TPA: hypothetical protein VFS43_05075 [Polyangiaceae bacterium]|nr:hypothetical protein [Polyangiaceae bacterium]
MLAASPSAGRAWVGAPGQRALAFGLAEGSEPKPVVDRWIDAVARGDDDLFAAIVAGREKRPETRLVVGKVEGAEAGKWDHTLTLPAPVRVDWPKGLLWEKPSFSRKTAFGARVELSHNRFGSTFVDPESGLVGLLGPGAREPACLLRVPLEDGAQLAATALAEGVLVVVEAPAGRCLVVARPDGSCGAQWVGEGASPRGLGTPVLDGDAVVVLAEEGGAPVLLRFGLPALSLAGRVPLGGAKGGRAALAAAPAEGVLAVVGAKLHWLATGGGEAKVSALPSSPEASSGATPHVAPPYERPAPAERAAEKKAANLPPQPERSKGSPSFQLMPQKDGPRVWASPVGQELSLDFPFTNHGGSCEGVYVEVSGPLVGRGALVPRSAIVEGAEAAFQPAESPQVVRAVLKKVRVMAGFVPTRETRGQVPPGDMLLATVRFDVREAGEDLLTVRVGPLVLASTKSGSLAHTRRASLGVAAPTPPTPPEPGPGGEAPRAAG